MNKLTGFAIRNSKLLTVIATLIWFTLLTAVAVFFEFSYIICGLIAISLSFASKLFFERICSFVIKSAYKKLTDKCDPYPFLAVIDKLIEFDFSPEYTRALMIDRTATLTVAGRINEAYTELKNIDIDELPENYYVSKVMYYNNLMDYATRLGMFEEADRYYEKALQLYCDMEDCTAKEKMAYTFKCGEYMAAFRKGDHKKAVELLNSVETEFLYTKVDKAMFSAKCYIALGETEKAREALDFVMKNANKTYLGKEAEELLKSL